MTATTNTQQEQGDQRYPSIPPGLKNFDELPDSAFVALPIVCSLFGCSPATIWRRVRQGQLIAPRRIGVRTTRWQVAELREELARTKGEK